MRIRLIDDNHVLFRKSIDLLPGFTILIGCNGAGKTTILDGVYQYCMVQDDVVCLSYNDRTDGGNMWISKYISRNNPTAALPFICASEGERIAEGISHWAKSLKEELEDTEGKSLVLLFDAVDSGMTIDVIEEFKALLRYLQERLTPRYKELYILVAASHYGMCKGERCFDVSTWKLHENLTYEQYEALVLKSRKWKTKRDKKRYENSIRQQEQVVS